jgi:hypothetical protein
MNQRIKQLWIAALRSGDYRQERAALHRTAPDRFCPFGVLCELHRLETHADYWRGPLQRGDFAYLGSVWRPPLIVLEWAGWPLLPEMPPLNIIELNQRLSFPEIADLIEASAL